MRMLKDNPLPRDTRKGDRHKDRHRRHGKGGRKLTKWQRRKIVAWDGEGANLADGTHVYNLLAYQHRTQDLEWEGNHVIRPEGLGTRECFEFFLKHSDPDAINVIFGGSYDVNMMLIEVPPSKLLTLWQDGSVRWGPYKIGYAHRKKFTVGKFVQRGNKKVYKSFVLWDVLGFFQSNFVYACRKWIGESPVLDAIEQMKFQRSDFSNERIEEIVDYNTQECKLLVMLMEQLFKALDEGGIRLIRYDGAGAIAGSLLSSWGVVQHKGEPPDLVNRHAQFAYSGGRIEAPKLGNMEGDIYRYDINSAYPSGCLTLPSYAGATWDMDLTWNGSHNSMVTVEFNFRDNAPFYPLWYRAHDGSISYPRNGMGVYWGVEIENLREFYEEGKDYTILRAINCNLLDPTVRPFGMLEDVYALRLKFKARGSMASEALKLGMNSIYGKLAQQAGYRGGRIPSYHQLLWAGQITAQTRAKLYKAAMQHPDSVIAFATDAIISTEPFDLPTGKGLGMWTPERFTGLTIVQPGVYWLKDGDEWSSKFRGFDKGSLSRDTIIECWRKGEPYQARLTRFVTLGSALSSKDFYKHWRRWETMPRSLDIMPTGKRVPGNDTCFGERLCATLPVSNLTPDAMSTAYPLLWVEGTTTLREQIEGVDIRLLEEEWMDSYA